LGFPVRFLAGLLRPMRLLMVTMNNTDLLLLGLKNKIKALSRSTGRELWSTQLPGGGMGHEFVTMVTDGTTIFAHSKGLLHGLNLATGALLWTNKLPGMGYGLASLCLPEGMSAPTPAVMQHLFQQQSSGDGGSSGAAGTAGA
jgi:outer membrane protein assembly factor BamB